MLKITSIFLLAGTMVLAAADNAAIPSEASIRELLSVTDARKLVDGMMSQMDAIMQNA